MRDVTRRNVCTALSALALAGVGDASALALQVHATEAPAPRSEQPPEPLDHAVGRPATNTTPATSGSPLVEARAVRLEDMPVRTSANGGESRDIIHGRLATGESVNLHQSTQVVGATPSPLHVIHHSEFILVREGEVQFDHEAADGQTISERVAPGGVIYVALGTNHRIKNIGTVPAKYFVVAIGGDAK